MDKLRNCLRCQHAQLALQCGNLSSYRRPAFASRGHTTPVPAVSTRCGCSKPFVTSPFLSDRKTIWPALLSRDSASPLIAQARNRLRGSSGLRRHEEEDGSVAVLDEAGVLEQQQVLELGSHHERGNTSSRVSQTSSNAFEELGLDDRVSARLVDQGVTQPTDIQAAAIPVVLQGKNAAIRSYTGSGKTLAYLLPVLSLAIQRAEREYEAAKQRGWKGEVGLPQALVVAPSQELAMQITRVAQALLPPDARRAVQQCIGGANYMRQAEALKENKPIMVVGTPGRLAELSAQGRLQTHHCGLLVLDEVDQLLGPHFREDMLRLVQHTGKKVVTGRQTVIVSATLTPNVLRQCQPWCLDPEAVFVGAQQHQQSLPAQQQEQPADAPPAQEPSARPAPQWGWDPEPSTSSSAGGLGNADEVPELPPQLAHWHVVAPRRHAVDALRRCIHALDLQRVLVFMNYQQRLKDTQGKLEARGMAVGCLHGELDKLARQAVLRRFRAGDLRALIVSDVAARGLDIPECDAVFNLELPTDAAHYAHRAGRTGRLGRKGTVVSLVDPGQTFVVDKLARRLQLAIPEAEVASGEFVGKSAGQQGEMNMLAAQQA